MKKYSLYLMAAGLAMLSNVALTSCNDDDVVGANDVLAVKSVLPTKVMEGQVVTITGTGLDKATSVVFPGNIAVSDIKKVGTGYITVVTPAGVANNGGCITVLAGEESAESTITLTLGKPEPVRVAPIDNVVKINECVEVYGTDLEFITRAYFPGEDGNQIVVNAENFKRKSTSSLFIYSPMGVAPGPAAITIEDCSGKKYVLPEIELSNSVGGGSQGPAGEGYTTVWEGSAGISWDWVYLTSDQFNLEGIALREGLMMRVTLENNGGGSLCIYDGWWGTYISEWVSETEFEFALTEGMVNTLKSGEGLIFGGDDTLTMTKIEIFREYPTIWQGEYTTGWWWYLPPSDLDLSAVTPEAGQIIKFTFTHHDWAQTFCLCDGWWGAPYIRDGGSDPNNIVLDPGEDFLEFEISEGMAATMNGGSDTALIIGGDITITRIQIKTF